MAAQALLHGGERYELLGELASGGMATVYLARLRRPMGFARLVAIKCMHPQFAKDPSFVSMFMDEARLTARLRHPNIVPTLDIVAEDGHLLLVMEYVDGATLGSLVRSVVAAGARIPAPIACAIVHDVLLGLHEAHQAKDDDGAPLAIIHRDVSPQNVLVGLDGLSRVLDFGVARARQNTHRSNENEIKGKVPYMPPEQLFGEDLDHRVDVYSAGVTLWEALVGDRLFEGPSETVLVKKISEEPIPKPSARIADLPPALDEVVMRALSRDPHERFESALAMAEAIAAVIALPTRTEVSAWVHRYVTRRDVPSGGAVRVPGDDTPTTFMAVLEKASTVKPSSRRRALPSPRARPLARVAIGFAGLALLAGGTALARVARSQAAEPAPVAIAAPPPQVSPAAVDVAAALPTPAPLPTMAPAAPVPTVPVEEDDSRLHKTARTRRSAPRATPAPVTPKPSGAPAPPAEKSSPGDAAAKSKECRIPFTIDAMGHKHYKVECVP